jgi:hypothetical protein
MTLESYRYQVQYHQQSAVSLLALLALKGYPNRLLQDYRVLARTYTYMDLSMVPRWWVMVVGAVVLIAPGANNESRQ